LTERRRFDAGERALARSHDSAARREVLLPGEPWADAWRAELVGLEHAERARWEALLRHAAGATGPRATPEWRAAGAGVVHALGVDELRAAASTAIARLSGTGVSSLDDGAEHAALADANASVLRGLVWLLMLEPWPELPPLLGALCTTCMVPVTGVGPRAQKVANACIASLGALAASPDAELRANATLHLELTSASILDRATRVAISTALRSATFASSTAAQEPERDAEAHCRIAKLA
jgi:hypothetical protein